MGSWIFLRSLLRLLHHLLSGGWVEIGPPYLRASLVEIMRREINITLKGELKTDEIFIFSGHKDFSEWSQLRSWVRRWLNYCRWYYCTAMSPEVKLDEFFKAPIVELHWAITNKDQDLGGMWKLYDIVAERGLSWTVPILPENHQILSGYLLGGIAGLTLTLLIVRRLKALG